MKKIIYIPFFVWMMISFACGGGAEKANNQTEETDAEVSTPESSVVSDSITLTIEAGDNMQYNTDLLKVTEGQIVTLILKHTGQMPKDAMGHNWVLLQAGTDMATFGTAAVAARDTDFIPADKADQVIAHTSVVGGGEEASVTFEAPKAGSYSFICSFPGHWAVMQGTFKVAAL